MLNKTNLSKILICLAVFFVGCKEFIEPSIDKKAVVLNAPSDGTETGQYKQTFWWNEVEDALKYRLQVVTPNFDHTVSLVLDTLIERNKFNYTLDPGTYQWRVRAENGSSKTPYTVASFVVYESSIKPQQVQLVSPVNNTMTNQPTNVFKWLKLYGADNYRLQIDTNNFSDETKLFLDKTTPNQEFTVVFDREKLYQWRVKAKNDTAESKWSVIQNITFDKTPPAKVILISPANNDMVAKPVNLRWEVTAKAKKYQLNVYKTDGKTAYTGFPVTVTTTSYAFNQGSTGEKLFWEVKALDDLGNVGQTSELRSFIIQ